MTTKGTLLLRFTSGRPQFYKKDKALTAETQQHNKMAKDGGNFNKCLIPNKHLAKWDKTITALRTQFYELTSPWDDSGYRICTPDAFWKFQRIYSEHQQILLTFRDTFLGDYLNIIEAQRPRLGDAFSYDDFPAKDTLEEKFKLGTDAAEIPKKGALTLLGEEEEKKIVAKAEERLNQAHLTNYHRLFRAMNHLATTLKDDGKVKNCHATTLVNVQELAEIIPDINFKDDPLLNQLADQARQLCDSLTMKELKTNEQTRQRVADGATETSQHIESMIALYA